MHIQARRIFRLSSTMALSLGCAYAFAFPLPFIAPIFALMLTLKPAPPMRWKSLLGLLVLTLLTLGPRYLPAPEVGMIMLLEAILGPLWVWLVIQENPGTPTLIGGSVVLVVLFAHSLWRLRTSGVESG